MFCPGCQGNIKTREPDPSSDSVPIHSIRKFLRQLIMLILVFFLLDSLGSPCLISRPQEGKHGIIISSLHFLFFPLKKKSRQIMSKPPLVTLFREILTLVPSNPKFINNVGIFLKLMLKYVKGQRNLICL